MTAHFAICPILFGIYLKFERNCSFDAKLDDINGFQELSLTFANISLYCVFTGHRFGKL